MAVKFVAASTQFLRITDSSPDAYTVGAWVRSTDPTTQPMICHRTAAGGNEHDDATDGLLIAGSKVYGFIYDGNIKAAQGTTTIQANTWNHLLMTAVNGSPVKVYLNGVYEGASGNIGTKSVSENEWVVGHYSVMGAWFDGQLEDFRLFPSILSASQILMLGQGYRGPIGGERIWLPMDGARATPVFDGTALAVNTNYLNDVSGNGNHGNPVGNPLGFASNCPRANLWIPKRNKSGPFLAPAISQWRRRHSRQNYYIWT